MEDILEPIPIPPGDPEDIPWPDPLEDLPGFLANLQQRCAIALQPEHRPLNRYPDVLPFDDNRCVLGAGGYINASPIALPGEGPRHIASQGPLAHTGFDLLRLALQEEMSALVQLTDVSEGGRTKCHPYLPPPGERWTEGDLCVESEGWTLIARLSQGEGALLAREIDLEEAGGRRARLLHLYYKGWPDHGPPDVALLDRLVREAVATGGGLLAHCSAGVGRTGTFFAALALLQARRRGVALSLPALVAGLRDQRVLMVQSPEQYRALEVYRSALAAGRFE